jgi:hypothetical protein
VAHQQVVKCWFDKHKAGNKYFDVGDLVLKWDKVNEPKGKHSKFQNLWLGPYQIVEKIGADTYRLQSSRGNWILSLLMVKPLRYFSPSYSHRVVLYYSFIVLIVA